MTYGRRRLARIIHERSGGHPFARPRTDEYACKATNCPHIDFNHPKSHPPYSSTQLAFVNNQG